MGACKTCDRLWRALAVNMRVRVRVCKAHGINGTGAVCAYVCGWGSRGSARLALLQSGRAWGRVAASPAQKKTLPKCSWHSAGSRTHSMKSSTQGCGPGGLLAAGELDRRPVLS